jgi:5-methyltetrahydrofolate--homocysteine methyltransferase
VLDASRAVPVTTSLLSDEGKPAFVRSTAADYEACARPTLRRARTCSRSRARASADADRMARRRLCAARLHGRPRARRTSSLATLREFIDWTPFFHTWELKGRIPAHPRRRSAKCARRRQIFIRSQRPTWISSSEKNLLYRAGGITASFQPISVGRLMFEAVPPTAPAARSWRRFHFSSAQQAHREGSEPCRSACGLHCPQGKGLARSHSVGFAVTQRSSASKIWCNMVQGRGMMDLQRHHGRRQSPIGSLKRSPKCLHKQVRDEWRYG